jgi:hypothetical protein
MRRELDLVKSLITQQERAAHKDYVPSCELSRMEQVHEAVLKAQFGDMCAGIGDVAALASPLKPMVFVRYNPDPRKVNGVKEKCRRKDREALLLKVLSDIDKGQLELPHALNIVYVGYNMQDGLPTVCKDQDYSAQMRGSIVLAV